jgi:hypothetical protein
MIRLTSEKLHATICKAGPRYVDRLAAAVRAGHRRASESRLAPALSPLHPLSSLFLPAIALKKIPPVSRRRRRYLTGFSGVAGGLYSAPMPLRIQIEIQERRPHLQFNDTQIL